MKQCLQNYRPVQQRTVRSQNTKDKAGALLPAVYAKANIKDVTRLHFPADQVNTTHIASLANRSVANKGCKSRSRPRLISTSLRSTKGIPIDHSDVDFADLTQRKCIL